MKRLTTLLSAIMVLAVVGVGPATACGDKPKPEPEPKPEPKLEYRTAMQVCGDPRVIGYVTNSGGTTFDVTLRFISARYPTQPPRKVTKTLEPGDMWVAKRWAQGRTAAWFEVEGERIAQVQIRRKNVIGPCPRDLKSYFIRKFEFAYIAEEQGKTEKS